MKPSAPTPTSASYSIDDIGEGHWIGNTYCIASECEDKNDCNSSDALGLYEHELETGELVYDGYCRSCGQYFSVADVHESSHATTLGIKDGIVVDRKEFPKKEKPKPLTKQEVKDFIKEIGYVSHGYRGIKDKYNKFFGHLSRVSDNGEVLARYYPETVDGTVTGYKSKIHPKKFGLDNRGRTGISSELSGQIKFKSGGKYVLITGGEEDKVAAYQMLADYYESRGEFDPPAVVSPTTGEGSAYKQIAAEYEFLDTFDIIIVGMDNDKVGLEAARKIADVLPEDKVKIALWSGKDPNKMLLDGREKQFIRDFYSAKDYVDSGVKSSVSAVAEVEEFLTSPKIGLPSYLHKLQHNMRGGIKSTGAIVNIIGDTSIGKSFLTDNLLLHWFYNSPLVPTIVSLERTGGELLVDMYSLHMKKNLSWFTDGHDALDYINQPDVKKLCDDMVVNEFGQPRFYIIDERIGSAEVLKKQVHMVIKKYGSRLIVFDPLTDFLRSLGTEAQEDFMMWEKMMKKEGVVFINVLHTRKPSSDAEGNMRKATEYDALGSGTFVQSSDMNIVLNRNKMSKDAIEKNTTIVDMPKCRGGITGHACDLYYDHTNRQQYDKEDYFRDNPIDPIPDQGVDTEPENNDNAGRATEYEYPIIDINDPSVVNPETGEILEESF